MSTTTLMPFLFNLFVLTTVHVIFLTSTSSTLEAEKWKWEPTAKHPCNIQRVTTNDLFQKFGQYGLPPLYAKPIIVMSDYKKNNADDYKNDDMNQTSNNCDNNINNYNQIFNNSPDPSSNSSGSCSGSSSNNYHDDDLRFHQDSITCNSRQNILKRKRYFRYLTEKENLLNLLGKKFTITLSSSNANSEHRRTTTLEQYLNEISITEEKFPDQLSNETWYLFGETYERPWKELLLKHYVLPDCYTCIPNYVALSFGIGNRGSGVTWHTHGPGFSESIQGNKHWVLYPPSRTPPPSFHKDQSSRQWMEYVYSNKNISIQRPYECTLKPGDILYFPTKWWHATINLDPYTVFVSTFTTEHDMEDFIRDDEL